MDGFHLPESIVEVIEDQTDRFLVEDGFFKVSMLCQATVEAPVVEPLAREDEVPSSPAAPETFEEQKIPSVQYAKIVAPVSTL